VDLAEAGGAPRRDSFCTHAVANRAPLVLQDAPNHPCFRSNRLVQTRGFRFYAGVPVYTRENHAVGTLCVLDFAPRRFSHFDLSLLSLLATRVAGELEWQARLLAADEPDASFRFLTRFDPELGVLGREAFSEAVELQCARALSAQSKLTLLAVTLGAQERAADVRRLELAFPADLVGRLQKDRVGLLAFGLGPDEAGARVQAALPSGPWVSVDLTGRVGGGMDALRDAEVQLGELAPVPSQPAGMH
jgi:GAF domain-containing protein